MDLSSLNPQQKLAVKHIDGPMCVVAGAGSGKTRVLTYRIGHLIEQGISARNILAVTFTKKAADEMKERLSALIGTVAQDVHMGTFHSICYRILRQNWAAQGQQLLEPAQEWWQKKAIRDIIAPPSRQNPAGMNWDLDVGQALSFISWQKNCLISSDGKLEKVPEGFEEEYRTLYKRYEEQKEREGKLDFDDMLLWTWQLLRGNAGLLARYFTLFRYILVDEFQDTNLAQYEILKMLAAPSNNVFVVGDARQAIYGWRAARVEFILQFEKAWPSAKTIILETNYRSTENIVRFSNQLIDLAGIKYPGKCQAYKGTDLDPIFLESDDEDNEATRIIDEIKIFTDNSEFKYKDCAVLYRVNAQSRALEDALISAQVPYVIVGATGFYRRKEVVDIIAYLRVLEDNNDSEAIGRVLNVPTRYLGKAYLQKAHEWARKTGISLLEAVANCPAAGERRYRGVKDFMLCIRKLQILALTCNPEQMVYEARRITGYDDWLEENVGNEDGADNNRIENLNTLAKAASKFNSLKDFLFYAEQAASKPTEPEVGENKVWLMTCHRSKGLEFPVVFLAGMNQGLLPHHRSIDYLDGKVVPESVDEERRLCYVGMTRAQERLYLSATDMYQGKNMEPSMFIEELLDMGERTELSKAACF
jgi:DNA helicase-2/ATP-dependent DNA helicase PcrA